MAEKSSSSNSNSIGWILVASLQWLIVTVVILFVPFLRIWWWLFVPLLLSIELRTLYKWWINWDYFYAKITWIVLEVIPPKEALAPLKVMEDVFSLIWGNIYTPPNWREKWCEGILETAASWMSFEIVSVEGAIHFYLRLEQNHKQSVESALYAHYPELEIREVSDYAQDVPQNIPNNEWDVYGEDFILARIPAYPIRTYEKFFEPQGEKIAAEEKRIDPIFSLLESMSKLTAGEQFWVQLNVMALGGGDPDDIPWKKDAEKEIGKIAKRPVKSKKTLWEELLDVMYHLIIGPKRDGEKYKWVESGKSEEGDREMVLTPGEREIITEIENKLKKPVFTVNMRGLYVAKRENWSASHKTLTRSYFSHFQTRNLNYIKFTNDTRPKTKYFFRKSVPFARAKMMFRNAVLRFTPHFPDRRRNLAILSAEELATLYHFPVKITGLILPTMARVESKKSGPPPNLPTE